jgi:YlmC/YmxH family sporulation protein
MRLSDLQKKDVINVLDGKKIGNIIDIKIEETTGKIIALVVEANKFILNIFANKEEFDVYWPQIQKIGEDVILIKTENF